MKNGKIGATSIFADYCYENEATLIHRERG